MPDPLSRFSAAMPESATPIGWKPPRSKASGLDLAAGIETLELDQAALEEREERRQDFLRRLFYLQLKDADEAAQAHTAEGFNQTIAEIALQD